MERPPELLKSFANRLADIASSEEGSRLARLLQLTGLFAQPSTPSPGLPASGAGGKLSVPQSDPDRVGIWERKSDNGSSYFVRRMDRMNEWNLWANVGRIDPKRAKRRVVLIGESVARGYLYDPLFTPAMALNTILQSQFGPGEVEVIDLARTNLGSELPELARSAMALEPDAVIIFSGNNWGASFSFNPRGLDEVRSVVTVLCQEGIPGLKRYAEETLAKDTARIVESVASFYESKGIPLIWIIPEFNLGDWREPATNAPYLPDNVNREWMSCWEGARSALRDGDVSRASSLAGEMVRLDQGVSVTGLYILAECCQRSADWDAARRYLEMARDAVVWDPSRTISPRPYSVVQQTLRNEVAKYNCGLVDLPALFKEHLKEGLPDRRVFLDYCHLISDGIGIAMAAAAASLLRVLNGVDVSWRALAGKHIAPTREVAAQAHFLAAIHNAHWWQGDDVVQFHCLQSVQASPRIAEMMTCYMELQTRRSPMLMSKPAEQIAGLGSRLLQHYLLRYNHQQLDVLLLDAMAQSLKKFGVEARARLEQLRREEHSVAHRKVNLLDYYYCAASLQPQELMWILPSQEKSLFNTRSYYYKAYWLESHFIFVGEAGRPVRLELTCRLPGPNPSEETITIRVNGESVGEALIGSDWSTWDIIVAGEVMRRGVNEILIQWPMPEFSAEAALELTADDLISGGFPEFFPVFGEIHSFAASDAREDQ